MNIFTRFKYSLISYKYYLNLYKESLSKAILHLVFLSIISTTLLGVTFVLLYNSEEKILLENLELEENSFTYEDGVLDFKNGTATFEQGETLFLIDTTKSIEDYEELRKIIVHKDTAIALTRDGLVVRAMSSENTMKYSELFPKSLTLDNKDLEESINKFSYIKYIIIIWIGIISFINKIFYALVIAAFCNIFAVINRNNFRFKDVFKLSAYSLTLTTILELFVPLGVFSIIISSGYVILAMNYMKNLQIKNQNI